MSQRLITAFASLLPDGGIPEEIVYLPEGTNKITPYVDGKPQTITVKVPADKGVAIAASLQASLVKRQQDNVRPWFDFEHKAGRPARCPKRSAMNRVWASCARWHFTAFRCQIVAIWRW